MFNIGKSVVLGAILAVSAPFASATLLNFDGYINTSGFGTFTCTSAPVCTFTDTPASKSSVSGSHGTLSLFDAGSSSSATNTVSFANFTVTPSSVVSLTNPAIAIGITGGTLAPTGTDTLLFTASGVMPTSLIVPVYLGSNVYSPAGSVILMGTLSDSLGLFNSASALFTFAETGNGEGFSDSELTVLASTPEPDSLVLLGTGLLSAGGMIVRRRRIA